MSKKIVIPAGYTEKDVIRIIDRIARRLAPKFRFGYHAIEDMEQQARLFAWEALSAYDGRCQLNTFLFTHINNRLHNYKRDNFERIDKPCLKCPINKYSKKLGKCKKYKEDYLDDCQFYYGWILRNNSKKNLMAPADIDNIDDKNEHNMWISGDIMDDINYSELIKKIKDKVPINSLENFNKFVGGAKLSGVAKTKIKEMIIEILENEGYINKNE
jgi:hypothetical protein